MVVVFGSHVIFCLVRTAMSHSRLIVSLRTAWSSGLTVGFRDMTESIKFW